MRAPVKIQARLNYEHSLMRRPRAGAYSVIIARVREVLIKPFPVVTKVTAKLSDGCWVLAS